MLLHALHSMLTSLACSILYESLASHATAAISVAGITGTVVQAPPPVAGVASHRGPVTGSSHSLPASDSHGTGLTSISWSPQNPSPSPHRSMDEVNVIQASPVGIAPRPNGRDMSRTEADEQGPPSSTSNRVNGGHEESTQS